MTDTYRTLRGPLGTAEELPLIHPVDATPESRATLAHWFVHVPSAHPFWPKYQLFVCHLRDIPGQTRPPVRRSPRATHDIILFALNPEVGPWSAERVVANLRREITLPASLMLEPINASEQAEDLTDPQAVELLALVAQSLVSGFLPCEPDDYRGGRARWRECVRHTAEHLRTGGHPGPAAPANGKPLHG